MTVVTTSATISSGVVTSASAASGASINGLVGGVTITPTSDTQVGLIVKSPDAGWGVGGTYGQGNAIVYLDDTGGSTSQSFVRFRVDRYGGIGTTGGLHVGIGENSSTYAPAQAVWIQPQLNACLPLVVDGHGDVDVAWFRNAALSNRTCFRVQAVGDAQTYGTLTAGYTESGSPTQVSIGNLFGVPGILLGTDALLYRDAANSLHTQGAFGVDGATKLAGNCGFFGTNPIAKPTGVAITAAGIHAALTSLGLIAP